LLALAHLFWPIIRLTFYFKAKPKEKEEFIERSPKLSPNFIALLMMIRSDIEILRDV
jgi:hypothetical protein